MLRMMMMQMGQKPSQKKINQMMTMMNKIWIKHEECEKVNSQLIEAIFQIWKWPLL